MPKPNGAGTIDVLDAAIRQPLRSGVPVDVKVGVVVMDRVAVKLDVGVMEGVGDRVTELEGVVDGERVRVDAAVRE